MKQNALCSLAVAALLTLSCSTERPGKPLPAAPAATDDGTVYGLVCDGSNDTIVVYLPLPYAGSDPDTLNILEASRRHQVFGQLRIGDQVAMLRSEADSTVADRVIVTQDLRGQWCYKVLPSLRQVAGMAGPLHRDSLGHLPDTIRRLLRVEREYSLVIKNDSVAYAMGGQRGARTTDENLPVVYPQARRYNLWYIHNGELVLCETRTDSLGQTRLLHADTAQFVALTPDTLVLRFGNETQRYYRKAESQ